MVVSETFPTKIPDHMEFDLALSKRPTSTETWERIVQEYSKCKLTLSRDKLVAISGLARLVAAETGDEYLAGMWRENLESQLCSEPFGQAKTPEGTYTAPSVSTIQIFRIGCPFRDVSTPGRWAECILEQYTTT
jgi:hypothetical protein